MSTNHGGLGVRNSAAFYLLIYISRNHIPHYVAQATMAIWGANRTVSPILQELNGSDYLNSVSRPIG